MNKRYRKFLARLEAVESRDIEPSNSHDIRLWAKAFCKVVKYEDKLVHAGVISDHTRAVPRPRELPRGR